MHPKSTPTTSPAWRMCSTSMPGSTIRSDQWSASDEGPPNSSASAPVDPGAPGRPERVVYEYRSNGAAPPLYTPPSPRPRPATCSGGLSSTTLPSTPADSTWLRDRDRCAQRPMSRSPHRKLRAPRRRDQRIAGPAKPNRRPHRLYVLHRQSQNQIGARLSQSLVQRVIVTVHGN